MLLETQSDSTTNSIKSVGSEYKQEPDTVEEVLYWKKASKESPIAQTLEEMTGLLGHVITVYSKDMEKQLNKLKRF